MDFDDILILFATILIFICIVVFCTGCVEESSGRGEIQKDNSFPPEKIDSPIDPPDPSPEIKLPSKSEAIADPVIANLVNLAAPKNQYSRFNQITQYDQFFKKYSKHYFGVTFDYLWFKSQSITESNLRPLAISSVGAKGLMQIMPRTWEEIIFKQKSFINNNITDPKSNIAAGIFYMSEIWRNWKFKYTWQDMWDFCAASYNAGRGNIIKAQTRAKELDLNTEQWNSIIRTLPEITGQHSTETINYVFRIKQCRRDLN